MVGLMALLLLVAVIQLVFIVAMFGIMRRFVEVLESVQRDHVSSMYVVYELYDRLSEHVRQKNG